MCAGVGAGAAGLEVRRVAGTKTRAFAWSVFRRVGVKLGESPRSLDIPAGVAIAPCEVPGPGPAVLVTAGLAPGRFCRKSSLIICQYMFPLSSIVVYLPSSNLVVHGKRDGDHEGP